MEVCGTHTMAIHSSGIKGLLPDNLHLVSGPGCPVCVTEKGFIDQAILLAREYQACLITFGDLIRVPGSYGSLGQFRSEGGQVRVVYSAMDALDRASGISPRPAVFLGVGFETTVPTVAATLKVAMSRGIDNLFVLCAFKTIHQPLKLLAAKTDLDGFLLPGHVSAIIGSDCYQYLVDEFGKPGAIGGFEPLDILLAINDLARMAVRSAPRIINDYKRVVRSRGNPAALAIIDEVFEPCDASWRGLGTIQGSGLALREPFTRFDANLLFPVDVPASQDDPRCRCAAILTGGLTPNQCGLFGRECTPDEPIGPCMVSSEGTCAAYYKYGEHGTNVA
jgi:hydrogenase expression/formation protein HypD